MGGIRGFKICSQCLIKRLSEILADENRKFFGEKVILAKFFTES